VNVLEHCKLKDGNTSERERDKNTELEWHAGGKINAFQNEKCKGNFYLAI
jgi:hypothetical protein